MRKLFEFFKKKNNKQYKSNNDGSVALKQTWKPELENEIEITYDESVEKELEEYLTTNKKCDTCSNNINDESCLKGQHMPKIFCNHYNKKQK